MYKISYKLKIKTFYRLERLKNLKKEKLLWWKNMIFVWDKTLVYF